LNKKSIGILSAHGSKCARKNRSGFKATLSSLISGNWPPTLSGIAFVCCVMVSVAAATKVSLAVFRVSMFLFVGFVLAAQSTPARKPQKPRIKPATVHFGDIGQQFGLRALTLTDVAAAARRLNRLHHGLQRA
jgi:hypothetical protein